MLIKQNICHLGNISKKISNAENDDHSEVDQELSEDNNIYRQAFWAELLRIKLSIMACKLTMMS